MKLSHTQMLDLASNHTGSPFVDEYIDPASIALWNDIGTDCGHALDELLGETDYGKWVSKKSLKTFKANEKYLTALEQIARAGPNAWVILNVIRVKRGMPVILRENFKLGKQTFNGRREC